jgi:hypothetical protein
MGLSTFARIPNDANQTQAYLACGITSAFSTCPTASIGSYDCKTATDSSNNAAYAHVVRAYTRTTQAGATGGTAMYPVFAPLLQSAPNGTQLAACSQVAWVYRSIANVPNQTYMPFAIAACSYGETSHVIVGYQSGGSTCASITGHSGTAVSCGASPCQTGVVGFNYAPSTAAGCASMATGKLSLDVATYHQPSTSICFKSTIGSAPSPGVNNLKLAAMGTFSNANTPESVYTVPIFDKVTTGSINTIHLVGFGYFKLQGYKFPSGLVYPTSGGPTWPATCGAGGGAANTWCIYGYFEPHIYSNSPSSELTEIAQPSFWDGTFAIKRIP